MLRAAQHDKVGERISLLVFFLIQESSLSPASNLAPPQTPNRLPQNSSIEYEETVWIEPYILYDQKFPAYPDEGLKGCNSAATVE